MTKHYGDERDARFEDASPPPADLVAAIRGRIDRMNAQAKMADDIYGRDSSASAFLREDADELAALLAGVPEPPTHDPVGSGGVASCGCVWINTRKIVCQQHRLGVPEGAAPGAQEGWQQPTEAETQAIVDAAFADARVPLPGAGALTTTKEKCLTRMDTQASSTDVATAPTALPVTAEGAGRFIRQPEMVSALQFNSKSEEPWPFGVVRYGKPNDPATAWTSSRYWIETRNGPRPIHHGDWIIRHDDGTYERCLKRDFARRFMPIITAVPYARCKHCGLEDHAGNCPVRAKMESATPHPARILKPEWSQAIGSATESTSTAVPSPPDGWQARYYELIYAVSRKHPGETRHETALRYIQQAEQSDNMPKYETASPPPPPPPRDEP